MARNYTIDILNNGVRLILNSETRIAHDGKHNLCRYENGKLISLKGPATLSIQPDGRIIDKNGIQVAFFNDYPGFLTEIGETPPASPPASSAGAASGSGVKSDKPKKSRKGLLIFLLILGAIILLSNNQSGKKTETASRTQSGTRAAKQTQSTSSRTQAALHTVAPTPLITAAPARTPNDWLTPGNPYEHYILNGRDCGMNGKMKGRINLICSFVNNSQSHWTDSAVNEMINGVWKDVAYLEQQASRYGVYLKFAVSSDRLTVPADQEYRWIDYLLETRYQNSAHNLGEVGAYFAKAGNYDQCSFLFYFNTPGRCVCYSAKRPYSAGVNEYAIFYPSTMDDERSAAHELYHLYGAVDYYFPATVKKAGEKYFPKSSMLIGRREMDELTAYLIGWTDSYSANALAFMNAVAGVTREEVDAALKLELGQ